MFAGPEEVGEKELFMTLSERVKAALEAKE